MKHLLKSFCLMVALCAPFYAAPVEIEGLETIGNVARVTRDANTVTLDCADGSQVRLYVLAADLIRVRAAFGEKLPPHDYSWAVAKTDWSDARWTLEETPTAVVIKTDEVIVNVQREPLLIEFRDAKTNRVINSDFKPMMYDKRGVRKEKMFDPAAGKYIACTKRLGLNEYFYGLGEKAARLEKRRMTFTNWNSDTPAYKEGTDPIYQTVPFYIGLQDGAAYGIFFDNSYKSYFEFGFTQQEWAGFAAEGGEMNYYFVYGAPMKKVVERYTELTGRMPLPPMWALGHQASRWSYYPDKLAEQVVDEYRGRDLPLDVMTLDIHYMQDYRVFTWDRERFPDPRGFTEKMRAKGIKVVTIVDPGVKYDPAKAGKLESGEDNARRELRSTRLDYYVYNEGAAKGYFQKRQNGKDFIPRVWPGDSQFVDYTRPEARAWWGDLFRAYTDHGVAGIWTDMNEPADFVDQTGGNQRDVVSYDNGLKTTHAKNRNAFALLMARATYEGLQKLQPDKRPYVITRAGYAGIQRYSTMWTGDAPTSWESLALSIPMFQSLGLSGETFVGSDVGGFIGRADGELLARSYQVGFLTPFLRNHHELSGYDHEPWRFGKNTEDIIRKYLKLRYRLMPFLYTQLAEANRTGVPLFRPLVLNYPHDESTYNLDDEFMVGDDLLAAPVVKPNVTSRLVYLPDGTLPHLDGARRVETETLWYDYWTNTVYKGGMTIRADAPLDVAPLYVRGGAIIPLWQEMNWIGEKPVSEITFKVYPAKNGNAATVLYEDDGDSPAYQRGAFRRTAIAFGHAQNKTSNINILAPEGSYQPAPRSFIFELPVGGKISGVKVNGKTLAATNADGNGWRIENKTAVVRIADNGQPQMIELKER